MGTSFVFIVYIYLYSTFQNLFPFNFSFLVLCGTLILKFLVYPEQDCLDKVSFPSYLPDFRYMVTTIMN